MRDLSRQFLVTLADDLHLPPAWRAMAGRATAAAERRWLIAGLRRRLLVATPHGRTRLRVWIAKQRALRSESRRPIPDEPWLLPALVREQVVYFGDPSILEVVVAALVKVPAPVRAELLGELAFEGVGVESIAWIGLSNCPDQAGRSRQRTIRIGPAAGILTLLHELAHGWHAEPPREDSVHFTSVGKDRLIRLVRTNGGMKDEGGVDAYIQRGERLADACAFAWNA